MTRRTKALITTAVVAGAILLALLLERRLESYAEVKAEQLLVSDLAGEPGKEVNIQLYTFPPGASVPWHVHPDAHEFSYELDGTLTLQMEDGGSRQLRRGETIYVPPNVVHRGVNVSRTRPAKLVVVRVKPKGQPLTTEVGR